MRMFKKMFPGMVGVFILMIGVYCFFTPPAYAQQTLSSRIQNRLNNAGTGIYGTTLPPSFEQSIGGVINVGLSLVGVIFLILTVYGGYIWMLARGDEGEAKRAKDIITMAAIGLVVVLAAYTITNFIVNRLTNATTNVSNGL